ncbi:hypothetical protein LIER_01554 [Lithospermum erythrorhizon]|uniref:Uncharacterized protein n=1 Tax=Lithospermum erythrorhizon TaxID=34254 RepID=A0AAV3NQW3_LITER
MFCSSSSAPTMPRLQTASLEKRACSISSKVQNEAQETPGPDSNSIGKMAANTVPLGIGSKGTVGSLLRQELEYFSWLESGCKDSCPKGRSQLIETHSHSANIIIQIDLQEPKD